MSWESLLSLLGESFKVLSGFITKMFGLSTQNIILLIFYKAIYLSILIFELKIQNLLLVIIIVVSNLIPLSFIIKPFE